MYLIVVAILLSLVGLQPTLQPETHALPDGLADAVYFSLGWQLNQRDFDEQQKLTASDGEQADYFGGAVALYGDTALVGAPNDNIGTNEEQGSVYVFVRSGGVWTQQQKLTASDGAAGDRLGRSVTVIGELALVSAYSDDIGMNSSQGSAYVFVRSGGVWTQQQKLTASDGATGDLFGISVALYGDTALIGAYFDDIGANASQGSTYVFVHSGGVWTQQQKLIASDGAAGDFFGAAVAVGENTVLVGAFFDAVGANAEQGSAYVFVRSGDVWTEQQKLVASDGTAGDRLGRSVTVIGELALVSAYADDIGTNLDQGSVYVFVRNSEVWTQQQKLTAGEDAVDKYFGDSIAMSGDTALVGAHGVTLDPGGVYVFVDPELTPMATSTHTPTFTSSPTETPDPTSTTPPDEATSTGLPTETLTTTPSVTGTPDSPTATDIPTDEPTATPEPGITELIVNGDFEMLGNDGKPDITPWTVKNASGDKAKCNKDKDGDGVPDKIVAYSGNCAFQFKGVVGEDGKLWQDLDLSAVNPAVGDGLYLSFYARSKNGAMVQTKVVFKYSNGSKTKINVVSNGTALYTQFVGANTLTHLDIVKSRIALRSNETTGKVYVDGVSLKYIVGGGVPTALPSGRLNGSTH